MLGASSSPWRMASTVVRSATTRWPSYRATVTAGVAVSNARSTESRLREGLVEPRTDPAGAHRGEPDVARVALAVRVVAPGAGDGHLEPDLGQALGHAL